MNILVLTSIYRDDYGKKTDISTNVVNLFAYEWVKQGHRVVVMHNAHCYPFLLYAMPKSVKDKLAAKVGFRIAEYDCVKKKHYIDKGVDVWRIPIFKYIPHGNPPEHRINKQYDKILSILKEIDFVPDIITGHWASPQMQLISSLKNDFNCRTAIVFHGSGYINDEKFNAGKLLKNIDAIGCRSKTEAERVRSLLKLDKTPFVCYSGVPDKYLDNFSLCEDKFNNIKKWNISCVCRLVKYKNVDKIITALAEMTDVDWELNIIGDGAERRHLEELAKELNIEDKVIFHGRVPRDRVMELVAQSHCFALISKGEIFGLVYLEAMAASSIAIGSFGEGIDGIIVDGKNGILCEAGDKDDLRDSLKKLMDMSDDEKKELARNGYETAKAFADSKVAELYIKDIMEW